MKREKIIKSHLEISSRIRYPNTTTLDGQSSIYRSCIKDNPFIL